MSRSLGALNFVFLFAGAAACSGGGEDVDCEEGETNCSGDCVSDFMSDPNHCGQCGNSCDFDNATSSCVDGNCVIDSCDEGFANCNGESSDGCEVNTATDPTHCGDCDVQCPEGADCEAGSCVCDGVEGDGTCDDSIDNDCDGLIDFDDPDCGTPACTPVVEQTDIRLTEAEGKTSFPIMVPTSSGFVLAYDDDRADPSPSEMPFYNNRQVFFSAYDRDGAQTSNDIALTATEDGDAHGPAMVATDDGYGIVFEIESSGVLFARLAEDGTVIAGPHLIADDLYASQAIAWTGDGFGVALSGRSEVAEEDSDLWLQPLDGDGQPSGELAQVNEGPTGAYNLFAQIAWDGEGFGVAWQDRGNDYLEIFFRRVGADGTALSDELQVTVAADSVASAVQVLWTGSEYGLVYSDTTGGPALYEVYLSRIAEDGSAILATHQVSNSTSNSDTPGVVFHLGAYWVSWVDKPHGEPEGFSPSAASPAIDAGVDLGMQFNGASVDIGAIEFGTSFGTGETSSELYLARVDPISGEATELALSSNTGFSAFPTLGVVDGRVAIAWFDSRDGGREVYGAFVTCE